MNTTPPIGPSITTIQRTGHSLLSTRPPTASLSLYEQNSTSQANQSHLAIQLAPSSSLKQTLPQQPLPQWLTAKILETRPLFTQDLAQTQTDPTTVHQNHVILHKEYQALLKLQNHRLWVTTALPLTPGDTLELMLIDQNKDHQPPSRLAHSTHNNTPNKAALLLYQWLHKHSQHLTHSMMYLYQFKHQVLSVLAHYGSENPMAKIFLEFNAAIDEILTSAVNVKSLTKKQIQAQLKESGLFLHSRIQQFNTQPNSHSNFKDVQMALSHLAKQIQQQLNLWQHFQTIQPPSPVTPATVHAVAEQFLQNTLPTAESKPRDPIETLLKNLLHQVFKAINGIHSHQLLSLLNKQAKSPAVSAATLENSHTTSTPLFWEIPLFFNHELSALHIMLLKDHAESNSAQRTASQKSWQFILNFEMNQFGYFYIEGELLFNDRQPCINLTFYSTHSLVKKQVSEHLHQVHQAFERNGIQVAKMNIDNRLQSEKQLLTYFSKQYSLPIRQHWGKTNND